MKFKLFFILILMLSCTVNTTNINNKTPFAAQGFAFIFNDLDFTNKVIKGRLDNSKMQISVYNLKTNIPVKLINPKTKDSIVVKNFKRIKYPDFYKILITEEVAKKLNLNTESPLVEIIELKKNKSFVAKKAKIFKEEKKISSNAPVTSVQISNISKEKSKKKNFKKEKFFILLASFYSKDTAYFLKQRINKEIPSFDIQKLKIIKKSDKEIRLISGPYSTINLMKNDYIKLKNFGFEELNFLIND